MSKKDMQIKVNREVMSNWTQTKEVWIVYQTTQLLPA